MSINANSLLSWFDRSLLLAIVILLVLQHVDRKQEATQRQTALLQPTTQAVEPEPSSFIVAASQHTISFSPQGVTESHVSRMARTLSRDSSWQGAPVTQAADMREHDGLLHIAVALSHQIDENSLLVSTEGNVLSLIASPLGQPHAKILKQFHIPCPAQQVGPVQTTVSNGIVRVKIHLKP